MSNNEAKTVRPPMPSDADAQVDEVPWELRFLMLCVFEESRHRSEAHHNSICEAYRTLAGAWLDRTQIPPEGLVEELLEKITENLDALQEERTSLGGRDDWVRGILEMHALLIGKRCEHKDSAPAQSPVEAEAEGGSDE